MGQEMSRAAKWFCVETGVVGFAVQLQTDCLFCRCVEVVSDVTSEDLLDKDSAVSNPCLYYESWLRRRPQEARQVEQRRNRANKYSARAWRRFQIELKFDNEWAGGWLFSPPHGRFVQAVGYSRQPHAADGRRD
jgi:hypothetical protein